MVRLPKIHKTSYEDYLAVNAEDYFRIDESDRAKRFDQYLDFKYAVFYASTKRLVHKAIPFKCSPRLAVCCIETMRRDDRESKRKVTEAYKLSQSDWWIRIPIDRLLVKPRNAKLLTIDVDYFVEVKDPILDERETWLLANRMREVKMPPKSVVGEGTSLL